MTILFVCTGNTCRSPMAEALMREALKPADVKIEVSSAGTHAFQGGEASSGAYHAMAERGIDLSAHRATQLTRGHLDAADLVLCMTMSHKAAVAAMGCRDKADTLLHAAFGEPGDITDPFGGDADDYRAVADEIANAVNAVMERLHNISSGALA